MATADLGIRIVLTDSASSGFSALGLSINSAIRNLTTLGLIWGTLNDQQKLSMATTAGAAIGFDLFSNALGDVISAAGDLQASMIQIQVNVKGADGRMQDFQKTLTNLADYSIYTSQEVADGFVLLGQKGYDASQILDSNMGPSMVNLAESMNSGVVPAAELLASTMRIWGATADQSTEYANALSFAFHNGVPSVQGLQQAIAQAGAQAVISGMNIKDFVLTMDDLVRAGIPASQAGTSLRYMLQALEDPTTKAMKEMADLGVIVVNNTSPALQLLLDKTNAYMKNPLQLTGTLSDLQHLYTEALKVGTLHTDQDFYQWALGIQAVRNNMFDANGQFRNLQGFLDVLGPSLAKLKTPEDFQAAIEQLFNVRGGKGAQTLLHNLGLTKQQIDALSAAFDRYQKANGVQTDAAKVTSGFDAKLKELGSTMHSLAAQIGMPLLTPLIALATKLNDFLNNIRTHNPGLMEFVGKFLLIGTVFSGATLFVTLLVAAISFLGPVLAVVGGVIAGVVGAALALSAAISFVTTHWKEILAFLNPVLSLFRTIGSFLGSSFGPIFRDLGNQIHQFGGTYLASLGSIVRTFLLPSLQQLGSAFGGLMAFIAPAIQLIVKIGATVLGVVGIIVGALASGVLFAAVHVFMALFAGIAVVISGVVTIISGILQVLIALFKFVFGFIHGLVTGDVNMMVDSVTHNFMGLWHGIQSILSGILQVVLGAFTAIVGTPMALIGGFVSGVITFFQHLWDKIQGIVNNIKGAIGDLVSHIKDVPFLGGVISGGQSILSHIPGLASGGVVTKPTLAIVGEGREPEVVLPVSKLAAFMENYKGAGGGGRGGVTVIQNILDGQVISQSVLDNVTLELRQMGAGRRFR